MTGKMVAMECPSLATRCMLKILQVYAGIS